MQRANELIELLGLKPHPEGGCYAETFRAGDGAEGGGAEGRGACTHIYYLLRAGERSHWHRVVDAVEIWHFYEGAPLELGLSADGVTGQTVRLGKVAETVGQNPAVVVPTGWWQSARSLGAWTLVGCTVSPGFVFSSFEMAPPGWEPGGTL
jgi:uncharacterized protein